MKKLVVLFLPIFLFFACDEIPPNLGASSGGEGPVTGEVLKNVLIEETTGVRCVNCPAGSEIIEQLLDIHGDRLFAISIHAGDFAFPFPDSEHDFEIEDGASLFSFLGDAGFPTSAVDRKQFDGEEGLQLGKMKWAGYVDQQLLEEATVDIKLTGSIDDGGVLSANVQVQFLVDAGPEDPKITFMITESNIQDPQETPDGVVPDYKHKHVLRDIVTPYDGEDIDGTSTEVIEREYTVNLPSDWNTDELTIIAVVHNSVTNKEILQVAGLEF